MTITDVGSAASGGGAVEFHTARRRPPRRRLAVTMVPWLFLLPALLLFLVFKYIPMAEGIRLSLFEVRPFLGDLWMGLDNYARVLSDERFHNALNNTLVLAVGQTAGAMLIGFGLALLLEGTARSLWFVRSAVFLPVVAATAVVGEIWRLLYYPAEGGFLNSLLSWAGLGPSTFLDHPDTSLWSVMAVGIWKGAPYDMVILLAGLAGIDRQLYESAAIDGCTTWQRVRYITLPALRPAITILLTLASIRGLRVFTEVYVLTGGGPAGSTDVWMTRVFSLGFETSELGVASAGSVVLFLVTLLLTLFVQLLRRRREA
ncbi:sugar ABC transporter permease [Crossiella sp. SN42]|uniref:carbohydrate ABC transporter permease n=1 Tax=Crossiella sp. SN42 TaxID=2944808 RepID=UPI00207C8F13|nr:sugar ABC transporter permease [Crossiella sp. SN42]MCO1574976.1 sugar ABC transporter permease [Crossiella sp. SN42]